MWHNYQNKENSLWDSTINQKSYLKITAFLPSTKALFSCSKSLSRIPLCIQSWFTLNILLAITTLPPFLFLMTLCCMTMCTTNCLLSSDRDPTTDQSVDIPLTSKALVGRLLTGIWVRSYLWGGNDSQTAVSPMLPPA